MKKKKLYVVIELHLAAPYWRSLDILLEFINQWDCRIIKLSTIRQISIIGIEYKKFKMIWGVEPRPGFYNVPRGAERFFANIHVVSVEEY